VAHVPVCKICRPGHAQSRQSGTPKLANHLFSKSLSNNNGSGIGICFESVCYIALKSLCFKLTISSYVQTSASPSKRASQAAALSILLSPGLLIIDHIHFQYNGFLYGILILSLVLARKKSTLLLSGSIFAALLCLKHIYLYLAPAYFIYLLRAYCVGPKSIFHIKVVNCVKLGLCLLIIFGVAFGPYAYWGQIPQLLSRLFPFSRGLCHAYWAPNVWSVYSFTDRVLIFGKSCRISLLSRLLMISC
jgi:alpha-1,3-glucosyltransferase